MIEIKKEGYTSTPIYIKNEVSPWILGNVLFGGRIGCGIDFISGGAYMLSPEKLEINMEETQKIVQNTITVSDDQLANLKEIRLINGKGEIQVVLNLR